ncbi:hypothetical protein C8R47DRAFT_1083678 [Mycena vitilis]|nr:hypothetical protein C8R47DRAFT_1083678 [Mycena vitilis]
MHIQRLSLDVEHLFCDEVSDEELPINLEHPLFRTVTHLDVPYYYVQIDSFWFKVKQVTRHAWVRFERNTTVFDDFEIFADPEVAAEWVQRLSALPALTHLAFSAPETEVLRSALDTCPGLRVLLVAFPAAEIDDAKWYMEHAAPDVTDMRFVVATYADHYDDWETGARGGHDQGGTGILKKNLRPIFFFPTRRRDYLPNYQKESKFQAFLRAQKHFKRSPEAFFGQMLEGQNNFFRPHGRTTYPALSCRFECRCPLGHDIWAHAEEFIARKRRGEVEGRFSLVYLRSAGSQLAAASDHFLEGPAADKRHKRRNRRQYFSFGLGSLIQEDFEKEEEERSAEDTE